MAELVKDQMLEDEIAKDEMVEDEVDINRIFILQASYHPLDLDGYRYLTFITQHSFRECVIKHQELYNISFSHSLWCLK